MKIDAKGIGLIGISPNGSGFHYGRFAVFDSSLCGKDWIPL
jgi:hypothetical protein